MPSLSRLFALLYAGLCYLAFLATFTYLIAFTGGFAPRHIDNGPVTPVDQAWAINLALLALFAIQHSGMARPAFKRWWTRFVPAPIERSTYVLMSSFVLALLCWLWRPLPGIVWQVDDPTARVALHALAVFGWLFAVTSTYLINHFDLFGLRQAWLHARGRRAPEATFVTRAFYRFVRHPLMLGMLIAFWAVPTMSIGHLLFTLGMTLYIVIATKFLEERDLAAQLGQPYRDYQRRVPMLLPWPRLRFTGASKRVNAEQS